MITSAVASVTPLNSLACLSASLFVCSHAHILFLQAVMNHLWLRMSLEDAIKTPIVFVSSENDVHFETGFDEVKHLLPLTNISNHVKRF